MQLGIEPRYRADCAVPVENEDGRRRFPHVWIWNCNVINELNWDVTTRFSNESNGSITDLIQFKDISHFKRQAYRFQLANWMEEVEWANRMKWNNRSVLT